CCRCSRSGTNRSSTMTTVTVSACDQSTPGSARTAIATSNATTRGTSRRISAGDSGQTDLVADVVDDLQHALAIRQVLHAELLHEAGVVDQVVAGNCLSPMLFFATE